jgi:hypothetical protein
MANIYVGIDPGFTGYIVVLNESGEYFLHFKTPTLVETTHVKKRVGVRAGQIVSKTKTSLDEIGIYQFLNNLCQQYDKTFVCVEKQHAMKGQGLASTAKNMYGFGFLVGLCTGLGCPTNTVRAVEWQKVMSDPKATDKKAASILACKNWNKDIDLRKTKKSRIDDHNLADAVNIARFTWHKFGPKGDSNVKAEGTTSGTTG